MNDTINHLNQVSKEETARMFSSVEGIPFSTAEEQNDAMFAAVDGVLTNASRLMAFGAKLEDMPVMQLGALLHALVALTKDGDYQTLRAVGEIVQRGLIYNLSKQPH